MVRHVVAAHRNGLLHYAADAQATTYTIILDEAHVHPNLRLAEQARIAAGPMALSLPIWFARRHLAGPEPNHPVTARRRQYQYVVLVQRFDEPLYVADPDTCRLVATPGQWRVMGALTSRSVRQRFGMLAVRLPLWFATAYLRPRHPTPGPRSDVSRDHHLPDWARQALQAGARGRPAPEAPFKQAGPNDGSGGSTDRRPRRLPVDTPHGWVRSGP